MQEDQEHYPITKDNIAELLEYNGIHNFIIYSNDEHLIIGADTELRTLLNIKNHNFLQIIEAHYGKKLNPIPKPKFDFVKYLLGHGAKIKSGKECTLVELGNLKFVVYSNYVDLFGDKFSLTKENADILIAMAELSKELS